MFIHYRNPHQQDVSTANERREEETIRLIRKLYNKNVSAIFKQLWKEGRMMDITRENNCLWDFFWVKNSWMEFRTIMELGKLLKKTFG